MAGNEMTPSSKAAAPPATIRLVNFISEDQARPRTLASPPLPLSLTRTLAGRARRIGRAKPRKKISWAFWENLWNFVVRKINCSSMRWSGREGSGWRMAPRSATNPSSRWGHPLIILSDPLVWS
jgi:hypothetical protein